MSLYERRNSFLENKKIKTNRGLKKGNKDKGGENDDNLKLKMKDIKSK